MKLTIPNPYGLTASQALSLAAERKLMPTALSAKEIQETIPEAIRQRSVFSARTTNAVYLQALKDRIERYLSAGYEGDLATLRVELKSELARLGYTPERGFPGDSALGIPPAEPGSIRDLSSDRRINLILQFQLELMTGRGQKAAGMDALAMARFPAWELIRIYPRQVPRDWPRRFVQAGGRIYAGRLIALKTDPVWTQLGDSTMFDDAADTDHPPYAFQSGMGWQQLDEQDLKLVEFEFAPSKSGVPEANRPEAYTPNVSLPANRPKVVTVEDVIPPVVVSTKGLDRSFVQQLKQTLGGWVEKLKKLTWSWVSTGKE